MLTRVATLIILLSARTTASAAELPISGTFGMDAGDCKAAQEENEGGYVAFEKGSTGEGGQGGCEISSVKKTGPTTYTLSGLCKPPEGPKKRRSIKLVVKSSSAIEYDGADYMRCGK